ncbi:murein hydrolase activator EnvC family protein [Aliarcobacter cibarius]|uniref:Peptidase M23 n=1 Tax=Aliarcobacter cibarius TaxID=255507 RepID=A0A5J6RJL1_9BACT|nr:peptidoglycan DD-metalloendopeptidase family protein [Aliarcobacter cibarius]QEZ88958.1 zinc metallopeptidase, M23 family [Aliarcobacter cibarius]QKJ27002.1 zinc metallopeptidase, M23 family [Aliarcobacter cibarius]TLS98498.1 peptidase M23 [Aliarcobacter cibarius]TLS99192.1 peptidase M23 [Aliarcobacter cibarius]TLT03657.1 peptidase M23 [Aliarcobacter cibarius]
MIKIIIILLLSFCFTEASSIDKKIQQNKKQLDSTKQEEENKSLKIKELADKIESQNENISKLEKDIKEVNSDIEEHQKLLEESKNKLTELKSKSNKLIQEKTSSESQIVDTIVEEFSISIALKLASENSLQELVDNEIYTLLAQHSKDKVTKINNNYNSITNDSTTNQKDIEKISSYINDRQKTKDKLTNLKKQHSNSLTDLEKQHKAYQEELNKVVKNQESIKNLLSQLNILKQEEIKKAEEKALAKAEEDKKRKLEALMNNKKSSEESSITEEDESQVQTSDTRNQKFAKNLNLDVKKIGSSTDGVTITKYKGEKTIAPLKSFKIVKNFGTYYDPVYKIKLFNESIVLKSTEPESKVVSVLSGKVVYAKKNAGMLDNVVIIQHEGGIHTIYSHLDDIAPTLVVGKWVQKGSVVGRVNETLSFQVTKDSAHIDPKDLFKI